MLSILMEAVLVTAVHLQDCIWSIFNTISLMLLVKCLERVNIKSELFVILCTVLGVPLVFFFTAFFVTFALDMF